MEEDLNYPNLERLCRLCLGEDIGTVEIYPKNYEAPAGKQLSVPMRIMACAALEVQSSDGLPKCICNECRYQLEKSFYFRKRCQLADTKLRKHIRLLSLGKKSRVFVKVNDDEDSGDEHDFEDSLQFIKEQDELRDNKQLEYKEKLRLEMEEQLRILQKTQDEYLQKELEERSAQLKKEVRADVWQEVHKQLRVELEPVLREQLRSECIATAKQELRAQVKQESRQIELDGLLDEIEIFLRQKRRKSLKLFEKSSEVKKELISPQSKSLKRPRSPTKTTDVRNPRKHLMTLFEGMEEEATSVLDAGQPNNENEAEMESTHLKDQSLQYEVIPNTVIEAVDDEEHNEDEQATESNFYILETDSHEMEQTAQAESLGEPEDEVDDETYLASEESEQFPLTASDDPDHGDDTTLYQIEANGEIQTIKGKAVDDMVYFNIDQVEEEEHLDMVEFNSFAKDKGSQGDSPSKHKDNSKQLGFTKCVSKSDDTHIDGEQEDQPSVKPFSRSTDTPKTFKCASCPMSFSTMNTLNRHYRTHVKSDKKGVSHECPDCLVIFSCKSALKRHAIIHTGKRPYRCDECGKSFVQREILKRHQQVHTGVRPYQCSHCPAAYTQKVNLTEHINHYHAKTPKLFQHSCHLCPKRFNHASGLSRHLASHSGISYQCMGCERTFGDRSSVKRHVMHVHGAASNDNANKFIKECSNMENDK